AFIATVHAAGPRSYDQPDLFVAPIAPASPAGLSSPGTSAGASAGAASAAATARNLTDSFDFHIGGGLRRDPQAPPRSQPHAPVWLDSHRLLTNVAHEGRTDLQVVSVDDKSVKPLTTGAHDVIAFTASRNASHIVALVSTTTTIGDLFMVNRMSGELTRLTDMNSGLMHELHLTEPEEISYAVFCLKKKTRAETQADTYT